MDLFSRLHMRFIIEHGLVDTGLSTVEALRSAGPSSCLAGPQLVICDPIAIGDGPHLSHQVFKFICIKLGEAMLFWDLGRPGNLVLVI